MNKWKKEFPVVFGVLAVLLCAMGIAWAATSDTYDTDETVTQAVGGMPICITFSGTSANPADVLTITLPTGFDPAWVEFIADYDATEPDITRWFKGMPDDSGIFINGADGVATYYSSGGTAAIDADAGTIEINTGIQAAAGNYVGRACR